MNSDDIAGGDGDVQQGRVELDALVDAVTAVERHMARAVVLAGRLAGSGVAEAEEGLPLELVLASACRLTGGDRNTLIQAGQTLVGMPVLRELFLDGVVSWSQVRAITRTVRRLSTAKQEAVDARIAATVNHGGDGDDGDEDGDGAGGVDRLDPDGLVWAVESAVDALRDAAAADRADAGRIQRSFFAVQSDLEGGVTAWGRLADPVAAATLVAALDAAAGPPHPDHETHTHSHTDHHHHDGDDDHNNGDGGGRDGDGCGWRPSGRARAYAAALADIAAVYLAGTPTDGDGGGGAAGVDGAAGGGVRRRARPRVIAHVDLADLTYSAAGTIDLAVRGPVPRLAAAAVDVLACDADIQVVVFDGARPLAATDRRSAERIPAKTIVAVRARDRGCRWIGCHAPVAHTDVHHLTARGDGGDHHPDNLALLCRRHHTLAHARGWQLSLDAATGELTAWRHRRRRWHTLPHATPLAQPDPADVDVDDPTVPF